MIFDANTRKLLHLLKGHSGWGTQVAWSHNGKWLASGSHNGSTLIWDAANGKDLCRLMTFLGGKEWLVLATQQAADQERGRFDSSEKGLQQQLYRKAGTSEPTIFSNSRTGRGRSSARLGRLFEKAIELA